MTSRPCAAQEGAPSAPTVDAAEQVLHADIRHRPPEMIVDGELTSGPLKEILEEAAGQLGYRVNWRIAPFTQSIEAIRVGTIDIIPRTIRKPDRESYIQFLGPIGMQRKDILFLVRRGDEGRIRRFEDLTGLAIGVKARTAYFPELDNSDNLNRVLSTGGDYDLARQLIEGRVDVVAVLDRGSMESALAGLGFDDYDYARYRHAQTIGNYYGMSMNSANAGLYPELNRVLNEMAESGRVEEIYADHQVSANPQGPGTIALTVAERRWLVENPGPFRVHNEMAWPPFNFNENGRPQGFSIDFMDLLAAKLGLPIEYVTGPEWAEFMEMIRDRRIDVMLNIVKTEERSRFLIFTEPFVENPPIFVSRNDHEPIRSIQQLFGHKLAVPEGFFYQEVFSRNYPEIELVLTGNQFESLMAVAGGEADATAGSLAIQNYLIRRHALINLRVDSVITDPALSNKLRLAVHQDAPMLRQLLQKAMEAVTQGEYAALQAKWFGSLDSLRDRVTLTPAEQSWITGLDGPLRVGSETDWPPFDFVEQGEATGFSNELLRLAAQKAGLPITFVHGPTWAELMDQFRAGELDILPAIYRTPAREEMIAFSTPYAANPSVLVVHNDNPEINGLEDLDGRRIALIEEFAIAEALAERYPGVEPVMVANVLEGLKAVSFGQVDAFIGSVGVIAHILRENVIPDLHLAGEIHLQDADETRLHLGVLVERGVLMGILQKGLEAVSEAELNDLRQRWLPLATGGEAPGPRVDLTFEERRWLAEHPTLRLGDDFAWPPFSFLDEAGNFSGISAGYMNALADRLGITVRPVTDLSWPQALAGIRAGQIDLAPAVARTEERERFLLFTQPYISFPIVIATRREGPFVDNLADLQGQRVGVVKDYVTEGSLREDYPGVQVVPFPSVAQGLKALEAGEVAAFVENLGVITFEIERSSLEGIRIAAPTEYAFELAIGVRKDWPQLVGILDKALASLDAQERAAIKNAWMAVHLQFGTDLKTILLWALPLMVAALTIITIIGRANRRLALEIEQRRIVQAELERSEKRIRAIIENAADGIVVIDGQGIVQGFSPAAERIFGYAETEVLGRNVNMLMPQPIRGEHDGYLARYRRGEGVDGVGRNRETTGLRKDGATFPMDLAVGEATLGDEPIFTGIIRDITERKEAEALIRENEQRLDLAIRGGGLGFFDIDFRTGRDSGLERSIALLGHEFRGAEETRMLWVNSLHPEDRERVLAVGRDYREDRLADYEVEYRAVTQEGGVVWLVSKGRAVERDDRGHVLRMVGTVQDVTARKEAELARAQSEERNRLILDSIGEGIFGLDTEGRITFVNPRGARLLGYGPEELMGQEAHALIHHSRPDGSALPREASRLRRSFTEGESFQTDEERFWRKDGSFLEVAYHSTPIRKAGALMGAVISFVDISRRLRAQRERDEVLELLSESIRYASYIQRSVLPPQEVLDAAFADHFVLWEPRDLVGGDLYWCAPWGEGILLILGDCTGHGVPGAFMTLIATGAFDRARQEAVPGRLDKLVRRMHQRVQRTLGQHLPEGPSDDGLELGACWFCPGAPEMLFVGARFSLFIHEAGEITEVKGVKKGIGYRGIPSDQAYAMERVAVTGQRTFYLSSDGLVDQLGGPKRIGFGKKRFKALMLDLEKAPMAQRPERIMRSLVDYQGEEKRRDDLSVIGFRLTGP